MSFFTDFWERIAGQEVSPDFMYRNTLGTGISDRHIPFSFTLYAWSSEPLDSSDLHNLEQFFERLLERWLRSRYPRKNYTMSDWEDWGKPIFRVEQNEYLDFDYEVADTYSYEINQFEEQSGDLGEIL